MEYIAVLNNYLEYSLDDNHTVNLSFQYENLKILGFIGSYEKGV